MPVILWVVTNILEDHITSISREGYNQLEWRREEDG
jgi:hypothetical protein